MHRLLQDRHDQLVLQYDTAASDVASLLDTIHHDLLPQLTLELEHVDTAWLSEWLSDVGSIFRLLRRHKFVRPFALQEIRTISIWRLHALRSILLCPTPSVFHCLPPPIADPFGRPLVFFKLASLSSLSCSVRDALLQDLERLRHHLRYIHDHCPHARSPLQYLVVIDLDRVSIQSYDLDLCSWLLTDVIPKYPGMFAAVFLFNHSWIHSSAWSMAKRVLPSSAITRVFFPSKAQLLSYCSAATLPAEYGGSLPALDQIENALCSPYQTHHLLPPPTPPPLPISDLPIAFPTSSPSAAPTYSALDRDRSTITIPQFSSRNPFFGYPVTVSASSPHTIRHVRKGLRQLAYMLAVLWWRRWRKWVLAWTWAGMCGMTLMLVQRIRRTRVNAEIKSASGAIFRGELVRAMMEGNC